VRAADLQQRADGLAVHALDPSAKRAAVQVAQAARHAQEWLPKVVDAAGLTAIESGLQIQASRLDEIEGRLPRLRKDAD
jgi:hypothetical protein